jgi:tetratricopeptide (TPR) repeat protein
MSRALLCLALFAVTSLSGPSPDTPQSPADRSRATTHYQNGWRDYRSEAFDDAVKEFRAAIEKDPSYEMAYYGLGRTYIVLKRYVEAIEALKQARSQFLASVSDRFNNQQAVRQRWQDQLRELDELIRLSQQGPQTTQTRNQARQLQEQQQRIRQNMDRENGVALDTTVPAFISLSLGSAYFRAERFPDAEREYKATLDADPKSGEAWNNLAVIYLLTGRLQEAGRAVESAEKLGYPVNQGLKDEIAKRRH